MVVVWEGEGGEKLSGLRRSARLVIGLLDIYLVVQTPAIPNPDTLHTQKVINSKKDKKNVGAPGGSSLGEGGGV